MNIKGVPVTKIFSIANIGYFILKVILYSIFIFFVIGYTIQKANEEHFNVSYIHLDKIQLRDYETNDAKKLVCLALDCEYVIEFKNTDIKRILRKNRDEFKLVDLTEDNINNLKNSLENEAVFLKDDAYIHNHLYYNAVRDDLTTVLITIFIILGFPSHFFLCFLRIYKGQTDQSYYKSQLENSLQRDLTENLNHELIPCVMNIDSSVKDVYSKIFSNVKIVDFDNLDFKSEELKQYIEKGSSLTPEEIQKILNDYDGIRLSISKMVSALNIVGKTKRVKTGNGTISLLDIIENTVSGINSLELKKIQVSYGNNPEEQKRILNKYSVGYEMDNGMMMCILHNIIKNSTEALANNVDITTTMDEKYIYMKIKDDGRGIRDKYNKILKKEDYRNIFINGYTTKNMMGVNIKKKKKITDVISEIFWKALGIKDQYESERGVGLNLNRKLLHTVGGDIKVLDTYYDIDKNTKKVIRKGTEIEIKFPYKFTKKY